jgi:serine/threonine-protein kinase haspin
MTEDNSPVVTFQRRRKVCTDGRVHSGSDGRARPSSRCSFVIDLLEPPFNSNIQGQHAKPQQQGKELDRLNNKLKESKLEASQLKQNKTIKTCVQITSDSSTTTNSQQLPGAWRKAKNKTRHPSQQEKARYESHVSQLKEQFAEIDAFELIAETPSPRGRGCGDGLGRNEKSMHPCDKRERSAVKVDRSGSMLERVSFGLQDALGWLNRSVLKSGGGKKNKLHRHSMDRVGVALDFGAGRDAELRVNSGEEIFTIGEGSDEGEEVDASDQIVGNVTPENLPDLGRLQIGDMNSLRLLLRLCKQDENPSKIPSMDALLKRLLSATSTEPATLSKRTTLDAKKVGEGTFGEVFKTSQDVVFKIVPMETLPSQKSATDILSEAEVSMNLTQLREVVDASRKSVTAISNVTSGFVETISVGVCRGAYSQQLIAEWNRWNELHRSENDPVDSYGASQLYAIFVQAHGGVDLETFKPRNFEEVKSILLQVALTLAVAENACQFEHRDLHWGNVLVKRTSDHSSYSNRLECTMNDVDISVETSGVRVTLIDFTLSRLAKQRRASSSPREDIIYFDLSTDPEIFNGPEGDLQADTYRQMQTELLNINRESPWSCYLPRTNAIWLEYLASIMLHYKGKWKKAEKEALEGFIERAREDGESAENLVWDALFAGCWE